MQDLIVLGAGGHGRVVAETASAMLQYDRIFHLDDVVDPRHSKLAILGTLAELNSFDKRDHAVALGIGDNRFRLELADRCRKLGFDMPAIIHPSATVSPTVTIGPGSVIFAGAVIATGSNLGRAVIVNHGSIVDHDCDLADAVHISPGATLAGGVTVGEASWIGVGANVKDNIRVGSDVIAGAGAAVVSNTSDNVVIVGVPARELPSNV